MTGRGAAAPQAARNAVMQESKSTAMAKSARAAAKEESAMMYDMAFVADEDAAEMEESYDTAEEMGANYAAITSDEMANSFTELAQKAQIGSFDEYKLASKLSVPDGNTALVNLIQSKLTARDTRLIKTDNIYNFDGFYKGWKNTKSFQTIELLNNSGVALDSGPITIYRNSAIIGEGYLSRTENDSTAYITFANEGRLSVSVTDAQWDRQERLDNVQNGYCNYTNEETLTNVFTFESHINNETVALLELMQAPDWTPADFPESTVKSDNKYVISQSVGANTSVNLSLSMKRTTSNRTVLFNVNRGLYTGHYSDGECVRAVKNALEQGVIPSDQVDLFKQYIDDIDALDTINQKIKSLQERRDEINKDQSSISQTLAGLKDIKTSNADALKNQLMSRQKSNEKSLVDITTDLYSLQVEKSEIELRLQTTAKSLNYKRN